MSKIVLNLITLTCLLLFLGWMVIWIVLPMEFFEYSWIPELSKRFNPTYIGDQGTNLFLLTFPVMLISVLGCIYLHLKSKTKSSSDKRVLGSTSKQCQKTSLRRPLLVLGPLGVVTSMELVFLTMFIALVIWHFGNYYYVSVKHPFIMPNMAHTPMWKMRFGSVSLRLGYAGNIAWAFLFFPVTRLSSILPLVGLTSEASIKYHIWIGQAVMVLSALHGFGFVIYWAMVNTMSELLGWASDWVSHIAGEVSLVLLLTMWATSFAYTRRKSFEVFFYTHQLYTVATFFYIMHIGVAWLCQILPGVFLFAIDRYLRFLQSRSRVRLVSARLFPGGTIELTFAKTPDVHYNVASNLFLNVPKISKLQWHPFTVISSANMEPDKLSIAFKARGSWTTKMYQELSSSCLDRLQVSVEGPYGPASTSFLKHRSLVLISGGSGITPLISVIRDTIHESNNPQNGHVPNILLVCAFKHASDLTMLDLLLPVGPTSQGAHLISNLQLQIQAYITQDTQPPQSKDKRVVQAKWFGPGPLGSRPITPVLGPNTWLWLGLIISSSFLLFLVLLAIVTQYHIYPLEKNTSKPYNFGVWCLWDVVLICISIVVVSSIVFLREKRKIEFEVEDIENNVEVPTPVRSPGSWLCGGDVELQSLPYQPLVQATQLFYGQRPNLQKILSECEGEDIGVVASGPRGLRQEVARICSTSAANNLHFQYLSFTW